MSDPSIPEPAAQRAASPFRLNLEQQRKRAKELLKGLRAGEAEALRRFRSHHPRWSDLQGTPPGGAVPLSEAQLVVARELGLPSWSRLKAHIAAMDRSWALIQGGDLAPDRDMTTLHIRCGSDIGQGLKQAGFAGDFLEYSDPLCQGPVRNDANWQEERAGFISRAYGAGAGMDLVTIAAKLRHAEEGLCSSAERYERIILWFEHDTYDQLILARCLAAFAERRPLRLELISPARFPGGMRFIGLGQLPPEALHLLWAERMPVPAEALATGRSVWDALREPDPTTLATLGARGTAGIPQLGEAVLRHCRELPWTRDGLSLTQRLILGLLAECARTAGQVFSALMLEREPLPWMTDLIFHDVLENMRQVERPVFTGAFEAEERSWAKEVLTITALGRAVLAGEVDWLSLAPSARWVGGVLIPGSAPCWRWNEGSTAVARC
ncbi:DUF1835 domain-containing protein [Pseudoroseomonas ludipueritiae]|uniref:DUF1835 domain-containing protein n=1 Tax=Pseudoroseomonas ludipueritiae TaxID=198093 RepID=UPI001EEF292C|nr:DUF1835 domain-containing protein [Pseudoroseomonas ludipueritiae]